MVSYDDKLSHAVIKYYLKTDLANNPLFFSVLRYHNRYYILRSQKGQRKRIILYRQHHQQILKPSSFSRHISLLILSNHNLNLFLDNKLHQQFPILPILHENPQVILKISMADIVMNPLFPFCPGDKSLLIESCSLFIQQFYKNYYNLNCPNKQSANQIQYHIHLRLFHTQL